MSSWHNYPSIYNLGHAALTDLFLDPVVIQEKIDGSQFSFVNFEGVLRMRSKKQEIHLLPENELPAAARMFELGVAAVLERAPLLREGWTYRGEFLNRPKHNTLAYDRVPTGNIIIFDINTGEEEYLDPLAMELETRRIDLEPVALLHSGHMPSDLLGFIEALLERPSALGGSKVEGVVIKNYARFGKDHKALMGKYVSEQFKEIHRADWKERNPNKTDFIQLLVDRYRSPARWLKAVQHLRESGQLEGTPRDIGGLVKEVPEDILKEEGEAIRAALFEHFWPAIRRGVIRGIPEFYKLELAKGQAVPEEVAA